MATITDVAKLAMVSDMTVSRVINHTGAVSPQTRARVEAAIRQLGYRPNMVAKGLATGRSHLLAYIMSDLSDPFHGQVSKGIENACFARDYTVIMCDAMSNARVEDCFNMLVDRRVDGAIFHHMQITAAQVAALQAQGVRCVLMDNEAILDGIANIESDDEAGGAMAAQHLIEKGHRRIGCIKGYVSQKAQGMQEYTDSFQRRIWQERTRGFEQRLQQDGIKPVVSFEGSGSLRQGFVCGQQFVREILKMKKRPTALYCENDILALGALSELLEKGIEVPQEMAIIGHDGLEMCMMLYPRITTIVQPRYDMGFCAAQQLINELEGRCAPAIQLMHSTLFQGDTT